jgi:hypothetical protein
MGDWEIDRINPLDNVKYPVKPAWSTQKEPVEQLDPNDPTLTPA